MMQPPFHPEIPSVVPVPSIRASDPVIMALIDTFSCQMRDSLAEIQAAFQANERKILARLCHKAGGSAAIYGFVELKESLGLLENGASSDVPAVELKMFLRLVMHVATGVFAWIESETRKTAE